jgi:hypothetical protein
MIEQEFHFQGTGGTKDRTTGIACGFLMLLKMDGF